VGCRVAFGEKLGETRVQLTERLARAFPNGRAGTTVELTEVKIVIADAEAPVPVLATVIANGPVVHSNIRE